MDMAAIISELDDHGFADTSSTRKVAIVQDIIAEFCGLMDFPFLDGEASVTLTSGSNDVTLPSDFLRVVSFTIPSQATILDPERMERIAKYYVSDISQTGIPMFYYPVADAIKVFPTPDAAYVCTLQYKRAQADLASDSAETDIIIPKRHHRGIIVNGALAALYAMEDDPENSAEFQQRYETRVQKVFGDLNALQSDRPEYIDDIDDYTFWDSLP